MINEQKITTMTRLALYDKNIAGADQAANDYFRHDYVYRKNLSTRIAVSIGGFLILAIYWANFILQGEIDIFELDFQLILMESILFMVALLALYSFLGTIQGTREYYLMQRRLEDYQILVRRLEQIEERIEARAEAQTTARREDAETGTSTDNPRDNS